MSWILDEAGQIQYGYQIQCDRLGCDVMVQNTDTGDTIFHTIMSAMRGAESSGWQDSFNGYYYCPKHWHTPCTQCGNMVTLTRKEALWYSNSEDEDFVCRECSSAEWGDFRQAAETYTRSIHTDEGCRCDVFDAFVAGAKWQEERATLTREENKEQH